MKKVKISIIHSGYLTIPAEASPQNNDLTKEAALSYINSNINRVCDFFHTAGKRKSDIVCTHEDFTNAGSYWQRCPDLKHKLIEKTSGEIKKRFSDIARQYSMYIASNSYETEAGKVYNTSTLYGRNGEIIGQYRKVHLPTSERWNCAAGDSYPVFETDIGNIGFAICYDMMLPEACRSLAVNGADIIIHPTQGWGFFDRADKTIGEALVRVRAVENSVYLIVSKVIQGDYVARSMVVDNLGNIVAESSPKGEGVLTADIEMDFDLYDEYSYGNYFAGVMSTKARQLLTREPKTYSVLSDENPAYIKRYKDMKLADTLEEGKKISDEMNLKPDSEKKKYYWHQWLWKETKGQ